jgi:flagellar hook-associated protein 2
MSSPITFSGFNNIDFGSIVTALMNQASIPLTNLQTQQSNLNSQVDNYKKLETQLSALQTAASAMSTSSGITSYAATSSDTGAVSVAAGSSAMAGHYDIVVSSLARAQVTASGVAASDADTAIVATGGTLTIGGKTVALSGSVTLQGLADAINDTTDIPVSASVVQSGANAFRLVLSAKASGTANAFTVQNGLSGSTVTFTDTDGNGTSGDTDADNAVVAADASLTVNNIPITSSSNTISTAIPGVTLTLLKQDPLSTVGVDVAADSSALKTKVTDFISAYNNLVSFLNTQSSSASSGDLTSIGRDSLVRQLRSSLRLSLTSSYANGGAYDNLSQVGVEFTQTGTLQFNDASFTSATAKGLADVGKLFAGVGSSNGAFTAVNSLIKEYTQTAGYIDTVQKGLQQQSSNMGQQIADMQARLAIQKQALQAQFTAADQAISALNAQTSSLSSLLSSSSS